jgi:hypothetical protein
MHAPEDRLDRLGSISLAWSSSSVRRTPGRA